MILRTARLLSFVVAAASTTAACAPGTGGDDGEDIGASESNVDSFESPTLHGDLQFGVPNPGEFTDDARFHGWTFTLPGTAKIELSTALRTPNLDTVVYLYKKQPSGSWGQNIASNDNHGGQMSSRIASELDAGEYLLKVKAKHAAMRGSFDVIGACLGGACPAAVGGDCAAPAAELPSGGHYSAACAAVFAKIAATPPAPAAPSCSVFESAAVAYYKEYWSGLVGWEEMTDGEDIEPEVGVRHHPGVATVVDVTLGGDEDAMTFVFEPSGKLLYYYQHNQSPDWAWFCDGAAVEEPGECVNEVLGEHHRASPRAASGTVAAGSSVDGAPKHVDAAIAEHVASAGIAAGAQLSYSYRHWAEGFSEAAEVKVRAGDGPEVTYFVTGDPEYRLTIAVRSDVSGAAILCKEIDR